MYIINIIVGMFCMGYGAYRIGSEASVAGFVLMLLGLANFILGVSLQCK